VHVIVVRSPHVYLGYVPETTPWATTVWLDQSVRTGSNGTATVMIPHPNDELGSTYGVQVESGGATADTRIVVPTGRAAIRLHLDRDEQTLGTPLGFDVYVNEAASGKPLTGVPVTVRLTHGAAIAQQQLTLDGNGHARGSFSSPQLGTDLVFASVDDSGRAMDAAAVQVDARASGATSQEGSPDVHVSLGKAAYRGGDDVSVDAVAAGSSGDSLITFESAQGAQTAVVPTSNGRASAHFRATDATGELRVGSAFVRDGAIEWATVPLPLDAPGRPQFAPLVLDHDASFAPGQSATIAFRSASSGGTLIVRLTRGEPSGTALFDSAPALLAIGVAATQTSAPAATTWHPGVDSTGDHAQVLGFVRRTQPPQQISLAQAESQPVSWSVQRATGDAFAVQMPAQSGRYNLSVLKISDDGSVSAGSSGVVVR
jgi:hypothetical protein